MDPRTLQYLVCTMAMETGLFLYQAYRYWKANKEHSKFRHPWTALQQILMEEV